MGRRFADFDLAIRWATDQLKDYGVSVDTGRWQGVSTVGKPDLVTKELINLQFEVPIPTGITALAGEVQPNREWADEHFAERVGGKPMNPDPSHERWPWWRGQDAASMVDEVAMPHNSIEAEAIRAGKGERRQVFTHTYSERFWPRQALLLQGKGYGDRPRGVRYRFGNYDDLLDLLARDPYTRQAYLPIFFPEDTGAVHGGRIPCSLGYHFLLRDGRLHCWYDIRSCDAVRHLRDDLYLAARLTQYTIDRLADRETENNPADQAEHGGRWSTDTVPGTLYFNAHSFHVHMGDYHLL